MKRTVFLLMVMVMIFAVIMTPVFATGEEIDPYEAPDAMDIITDGADSATIEDVEGYIDNKGGEIIYLLQYVGQPILIIAFILFVFLAVFGAFGNPVLISKGILGMIISGVCYFLVLYAPDIVVFISSWVKP